MRTLLAILLLLLAGCASPAAGPDGSTEPDAPAAFRVDEPASFLLQAAPAQTCVAIVCDAGQRPGDAMRTELAHNRSLVAVDLQFASDAFLEEDSQLRITLRCDGIRDCGFEPAEVVGRPPLRLTTTFEGWPRGHAMLLSAYVEGTLATAYELYYEVNLEVTGTYTYEQDPPLPDAAPVLERFPLRESGEAAACSVTYTNCGGGGFGPFGPFEGVVEHIEANITWASNSPQSERLVAQLYCSEDVPGGSARCDGVEQVEVEGTSPLRVRLENAGYHKGSQFTIYVFGRSAAEPYPTAPIVPQPLELEGSFLLRPSAE